VYYLSGTLRPKGRPSGMADQEGEEASVSDGGVILASDGPATRRNSPARRGRPDRAAPGPARTSAAPGDTFYNAVRLVVRFWLWFCFKPVDVRHPEHVPAHGPVLLCINHPNNLIDSFVVATALRRKIHFLAAAAMFRHWLGARFLRACGAIPVCRKDHDPDKMDPNAKAFAACFQTLDRGGLIAIYPEGSTHAEACVRRIKSGAARIALGYESACAGELSLVPVGLTFEARKSFLGRVLVSFGAPIPLSSYREAHREDPRKAVVALTRAIQRAMEAEIVHVEPIEAIELVRAIEELHQGGLISDLSTKRGLDAWQIDPLGLPRVSAEAVNSLKAREPERVERLWHRIQGYLALLAEFHLTDESVQSRRRRPSRLERIGRSGEAVVGFPFFVYGAVVNGLPYLIPCWLAHLLARKETDYATVRFLASVVAFPLFWALETWVVGQLSGAAEAAGFALSLPLTAGVVYRYLGSAGRLRRRLRVGVLALTHAQAARCLMAERGAIIAGLERAQADCRAPERRQPLSPQDLR